MNSSEKIVTRFIHRQVEEISEYLRGKYDTPFLKVDVKLSFSPHIRTSRGGRKESQSFIKLAVYRYVEALSSNRLLDEFEYRHYRHDPVIGELKGVHWTKALMLLITHELAHVVQFTPSTFQSARKEVGLTNLDSRNQIFKKHDWFFQRIYADLRTKYVNNFSQLPVDTTEDAPVESKRIINKGWYSTETCSNGGRYGYYYRTDGTLIGCLFNRWKEQVYIYDSTKPKGNQYTPTGLYDVRQARRQFFNL